MERRHGDDWSRGEFLGGLVLVHPALCPALLVLWLTDALAGDGVRVAVTFPLLAVLGVPKAGATTHACSVICVDMIF